MQYVFAFSHCHCVITGLSLLVPSFSNPSLYHFTSEWIFFLLTRLLRLLVLVLVLFCIISSYLFRLFFVLDEWASVIWWGLICLVKHANSSKGLFKITNLVCLFDSPSPFIYCRFANHKNQLKKGLPGWMFGYSIICLFTFIYTRTLSLSPFSHFNTAIFLWMVSRSIIIQHARPVHGSFFLLHFFPSCLYCVFWFL